MQNDLIINYSEQDNLAKEGKQGWVDDFSRFLTIMLSQITGHPPKILKKSDKEALTHGELENTRLLLSVVSPNFVKSDNCREAVEEFHKLHGPHDPPLIFKVMLTDVPYSEQPAALQEILPYELYDLDYDSGESLIFEDYFSPEAEHIYWMKMVDLAYDLQEALTAIHTNKSTEGVKPLYDRETIYLAETAKDLVVQRNILRRELQRHGFRVVPTQALPHSQEAAEAMIKKLLDASTMSIHLIGTIYGDIPEGGTRSLVDLQNRLAIEKIKNNPSHRKLQRLIWISPNTEKATDQQLAFIENIQRDLSALEATEIFQVPLEDFKNTLREELFSQNGSSVSQQTGGIKIDDKKLNVYLIYDKVDEEQARLAGKEFTKAGLNVIHPELDGDVLTLRKAHIERLRVMDLGVIFKGQVKDNWVRMKTLDLLKAPGLGREKPIAGRAVIVANGNDPVLDLYGEHDIEILRLDDKEPLVQQIDAFIANLTKVL